MTLTEKIELIQSSSSKDILNGGGHEGTPLLKYVFQVHEEVFGMACKSCADALAGYIKKIQSININDTIMGQQERQYRMKSGSVIRVNGTNDYFSDANLTDEVAEKLLKVNPNRAQLFAKMPKGALERLAKETKEEEAQLKLEAKKAKADKKAKEKAANKVAPAKTDSKLEVEKTDSADDNTSTETKNIEVKDSEEIKADEPVKDDSDANLTDEVKVDADLNMNELREKYPTIKARSKEEFLTELEDSKK